MYLFNDDKSKAEIKFVTGRVGVMAKDTAELTIENYGNEWDVVLLSIVEGYYDTENNFHLVMGGAFNVPDGPSKDNNYPYAEAKQNTNGEIEYFKVHLYNPLETIAYISYRLTYIAIE